MRFLDALYTLLKLERLIFKRRWALSNLVTEYSSLMERYQMTKEELARLEDRLAAKKARHGE